MISRLGSVVLSGALLCAAAAPASAEDVWSDPYPGVRRLERKTDKQKIHVVVVDLGQRNIRLRATKSSDRGTTVSKFARDYGCQIAVNGDFFKSGYATEGLAMGSGVLWPSSSDGPKWGFVAFGATPENHFEISLPAVVGSAEPWMSEIVGGYPLLVDSAAASSSVECSTDFCNRNPRTAVGLGRDGKTLYIVAIDGRKSTAVGMSLREEAALMIELGAWRAINLDGGGSTAMFIGDGIVNTPSDGFERTVGNHLGVVIDDAPAMVDAGTDARAPAADAGPPSDAGAGDAPILTPEEEQLAGACAVGQRGHGAAGLLLVLLLVLARRRRRC